MSDDYRKEWNAELNIARKEYDAYVKACHSNPLHRVSEFNFEEWIEAGRPSGPSKG